MIRTDWTEQSNSAFVLSVTESGGELAVGRLRAKGGTFFIEHIFVPINLRGQGYGNFAARLMIRKCYELGGCEQRVLSPVEAVGFFEALGFVALGEPREISGGVFTEMARRGDISGDCGLYGEFS